MPKVEKKFKVFNEITKLQKKPLSVFKRIIENTAVHYNSAKEGQKRDRNKKADER